MGRDVSYVFRDRGAEVLDYGRKELDVTDAEKVMRAIESTSPDLVIHAAAFTQVDRCESEEDLAYSQNALGARNVAAACLETHAAMVYVSTDYVFDGKNTRMYREDDTPNPLNIYGKSKLAGEELVRQILPRHYICRTSWLYGREGQNFVYTMLKLAQNNNTLRVVNDQTGTPTATEDLAHQIYRLALSRLYGTYHVSGQGECTWYDFAREIMRLAGKNVEILPQSTADAARAAARPRYSVLDNYRLRLSGLDIMPSWQESLHRFFQDISKLNAKR